MAHGCWIARLRETTPVARLVCLPVIFAKVTSAKVNSAKMNSAKVISAKVTGHDDLYADRRHRARI